MESLFNQLSNNSDRVDADNLIISKRPTKVVVAPFHLGFPLDLCRMEGKGLSHKEVMLGIANVLESVPSPRFQHIAERLLAYDENVSVPMGRPLVVRDTGGDFGRGAGCYVILFSTGLFLVTVHYYEDFPLEDENFHEDDNSHGFDAYGCLEESGRAFAATLREWSNKNVEQIRPLFDTDYVVCLLDAYYIEIEDDNSKGNLAIKYFDAVILRKHTCVLLYAYASYYSILWLQKKLSLQIGDLKVSLLSRQPAPKGMVENLKALGLHIQRLISETNPFSIRITHDYIAALRSFRAAYDMESLEGAVKNQSDILEAAITWFDAQAKERFNNSIGLAALLLSFVSITAVIAQIVSTLDLNNQYDSSLRSILIFGGAFMMTGVIVFITYTAWRQTFGKTNRRG